MSLTVAEDELNCVIFGYVHHDDYQREGSIKIAVSSITTALSRSAAETGG